MFFASAPLMNVWPTHVPSSVEIVKETTDVSHLRQRDIIERCARRLYIQMNAWAAFKVAQEKFPSVSCRLYLDLRLLEYTYVGIYSITIPNYDRIKFSQISVNEYNM